jgi:hypothetical protein
MSRFRTLRKKLRGRNLRLRSREGKFVVIGPDSVPLFSSTDLTDIEMFRQVYNNVKRPKNAKRKLP